MHNKGLKNNLNCKRKNWMKTSALDTEKAISFLPFADQDYFIWLVARNKNNLYLQHAKFK
jgi:hypothetical protein